MDRRAFVTKAAATVAVASVGGGAEAALATGDGKVAPPDERFAYFLSTPVGYRAVHFTDTLWAARQQVTRDVTVPWVTGGNDPAGGVRAYRSNPAGYVPRTKLGDMEAVKFVEAMASVIGRDPTSSAARAIQGYSSKYIAQLISVQSADGYLQERYPVSVARPKTRWQPSFWSHEDYLTGHYIEAAIAYREATGQNAMLASAIRAADNMVADLGAGSKAYAPGHPEIEKALIRLYGVTGQRKYLELSHWLMEQRGNHAGRPSYGVVRLDEMPVKDRRSIAGHAVMAAYLYDAVTHYVGATGDEEYRTAALAVWRDMVDTKMYLHGGVGNASSRIEGYRSEPYCILPDDAYAESCASCANFIWAHSLFRLTGDSSYIDVAERILYNAFLASLSLAGDSSFYENVAQTSLHVNAAQMDQRQTRSAALATSCCPPNIVKLFNTLGGYLYSTDREGIIVKHFAQSEADIPFGHGVSIEQQTRYPWEGNIALKVRSHRPQRFRLRLRVPDWASSCAVQLDGDEHPVSPNQGWIDITRKWSGTTTVTLALDMPIERVTLGPQFAEYENRAALKRGPIVYCLEEQDIDLTPPENANDYLGNLASLYIPEDVKLTAEMKPDLLGGVTVLSGQIKQLIDVGNDTERPIKGMFVPYGWWGNRNPGAMRIWLGARRAVMVEMVMPQDKLGHSCVG